MRIRRFVPTNKKPIPVQHISKKNTVRAGEFWTINDAKTRGHNSLILVRKNEKIIHAPTTHHSSTRNMKNIKLEENPNPLDTSDSYVLPKAQVSKVKDLGKKRDNMKIKNASDKSKIRHIKKVYKKSKKKR